jgi:predicted phage baseplate assembly protein
LVLTGPLANAYDRATMRFAANVVSASHGETREEVLGSGDAGAAFQTFVLAAQPDPRTGRVQLTYLRSTVPGGAATSLAVDVDGVRWREVSSLHGAGPRDRVYTVRVDTDSRVRVQMGDGVTGARVPSGTDNVTARYRLGTGLAGVVPARRITLLVTRPLGVRDVTNPLPTGLAEDPEGTESIRRGIPRTALTLDRVVSLVDYEETARSFAGIAKARARFAWDQSRVVHVTVAGAGGLPVDDETRRTLVASLTAAGDLFQPVRVVGHTPVLVSVSAVVVGSPDRQNAAVEAGVIAAVRDAFSFDRRDFHAPVTEAEVAAVIQAVEGVVGVGSLSLTREVSAGSGDALETVRPDGIAITVTGGGR